MKVAGYLVLFLCIVLLFNKANSVEHSDNAYESEGEEKEEEWDKTSLLEYVTKTHMQDPNKIWTEKEAFKPM